MPKFGEKNLNINAANITSGTLSANRLPVATTSTLGGVKVDGTTISIANGVVTANAGAIGGGSSMVTKLIDKPTSHKGSTSGYKRTNGGLAEVNGLHYVVGGYTDASNSIGTISNTILIYDPVKYTHSTTTAAMATPRFNHQTVAYNGKIYVFGGLNSSNAVVNTTEMYDPVSNTWTTKSSNPNGGFSGNCAVLYDNKIHLMGGGTNRHQVYDPELDSWSTAANLPSSWSNFAVMATPTGIVIAGGNNGSATTATYFWTASNDSWAAKTSKTNSGNCSGGGNGSKMLTITWTNSLCEVYDVAGDNWTTVPILPEQSSINRSNIAVSMSTIDGMLYTHGGHMGASAWTSSWYEPFNFTSMDWGKVPRMKTRRHSYGLASVGNKLYLIGGATATGASAAAVATNEVYDPSTRTWTTKTSLTTARRNFACAVVGTKIYCIGGTTNGTDYLNSVEIYDTTNDTWSTGTNMTTARSFTCAAASGNIIYVVAGKSSGSPGGSNLTEAYDTVGNSWSSKTNFPLSAYNCAAFTYSVSNNPYVLAGNQNGTGTVNGFYEYSVTGNTWTSRGGTNGQTLTDLFPQMVELDGTLYTWSATHGLLFSVAVGASTINGNIVTTSRNSVTTSWSSDGSTSVNPFYGGLAKVAESQGNIMYLFSGSASSTNTGPVFGCVESLINTVPPYISTGNFIMQNYLNSTLSNITSGVSSTILPVKTNDSVTYRTISTPSFAQQYLKDELFLS